MPGEPTLQSKCIYGTSGCRTMLYCFDKGHLAYRADIHNLYRQLRLCDNFSPAPSRLFISGSEEDKRLFDIIVRSYSAARYKDDFKVEQADVEQIFTCVSTFLKLTEIM